MVSLIKDNSLVYFLLEKSNMLFQDFTIDHVVAFDLEDDFHLVIYNSASKDFVCFTVVNYLQESDALPSLMQFVQEYSDSSITSLLEEAMKIIESKFHSKNNFRFFFDAH